MSTPATPSPRNEIKILVVEDSPTQAQQLQHILTQQGYHVTITANGRQALEMARHEKPTLIISDIVMPELDGYSLCRQIKTDAKLGDIPVILVTTLSDPHDVIRGLECRADNFILKPYDEHYLLNRVRFVLANRAMSQTEPVGMGVEIYFNGHRHFITADRLQILNLLLSTYEAAIQRNKELSRVQQELRSLNASLEAANNELESFSYSVSHDLRAPLRAIDGFSNLLIQKFATEMPAEAQRWLKNVNDGAKQMGLLIDDLLKFSRLNREPLTRQTVNTNELVNQVLAELREQMDLRPAEVRIQDLPPCTADPRLLKQVWVNLLANAFKYTRKVKQPVIEIGIQSQAGESAYYVRDNGAGFDMQYAAKLFGVFQRLHDKSEFEGTGVGLSIVHRIIQRHGGRIWAQAEINKGATFYFTLPQRATADLTAAAQIQTDTLGSSFPNRSAFV